MLRDMNNPTAAVELTSEDRTLERACPTCGQPVSLLIPAGVVVRVAQVMARMSPECEACTERREAAEAAREGVRLRRQRAEVSGLPPDLRGLEFDGYEVADRRWRNAERARDAALAWVAAGVGGRTAARRGLLVHGPVGVGKTRLAATAAWRLLLSRDVRYVNVPDLIIKLGAAFGDKDRAVALKVLTGRGALVLDDLDKLKPSTNVLTHIYTAINNRYEAGAPLFVTTNLDPKQLVAYFAGADGDDERRVIAEAIVSRLMQHCVVGRIDGPDRRRV